MYGFDVRPVSISGANGSRATMFASGLGDFFRAPSARSPFLGQTTGQGIYDNAKEQIRRFDSFVERTKKLANKQSRERIADDFGLGEPNNKDKAFYERNATAGNVAEADSYTPPNYYIFEVSGPAKNRPARLQDWNHEFKRAVEDAETTWGILPEPQIIERMVLVPGAATMSPLVPVLVTGGLVVVGLALFGAL